MTLPTVNDVQAVDPVLTNLLVGFMQADARFVASKVFPVIPTEKDSGTFYTFTQKYWFLDQVAPRAAGEKFARGGYGVGTDTFTTLGYGLEHVIPDETRRNSQVPMSLEEAGLRWLAAQSLIRKERGFAADFMKASVWGTTNSSATDWDDFSSGDPVADVLTARLAISQATGMDANSIVLGEIVHNAIVNHPDIIDRMKYVMAATQANVEGVLAAVLGLQNYWVAKAIYNSANEGQTMTAAAIVDDDALVCAVAPAPGLLVPSAGYTFAWDGGGGMGSIVPYRDQAAKSDILQHAEQWDQKAVATDLGYIFTDIV